MIDDTARLSLPFAEGDPLARALSVVTGIKLRKTRRYVAGLRVTEWTRRICDQHIAAARHALSEPQYHDEHSARSASKLALQVLAGELLTIKARALHPDAPSMPPLTWKPGVDSLTEALLSSDGDKIEFAGSTWRRERKGR